MKQIKIQKKKGDSSYKPLIGTIILGNCQSHPFIRRIKMRQHKEGEPTTTEDLLKMADEGLATIDMELN